MSGFRTIRVGSDSLAFWGLPGIGFVQLENLSVLIAGLRVRLNVDFSALTALAAYRPGKRNTHGLATTPGAR